MNGATIRGAAATVCDQRVTDWQSATGHRRDRAEVHQGKPADAAGEQADADGEQADADGATTEEQADADTGDADGGTDGETGDAGRIDPGSAADRQGDAERETVAQGKR